MSNSIRTEEDRTYRLRLNEIVAIVYQNPVYEATEHNYDWLVFTATQVYLEKDLNPDDYITLVIPTLRTIFLDNIEQLPGDEQAVLRYVVKGDTIIFENALFPTSSDEKDLIDYKRYELTQGQITKFDVIALPLRDYINILNGRNEFYVDLKGTDLRILLSYDEYDFYDRDLGKVIKEVHLD